ncbi:MAG: hypothetical protein F6K19_00460 [Cyanothece sp. SIO1E1]|nr:hypothetical protein [Cyanothece sp. SIO1E1]
MMKYLILSGLSVFVLAAAATSANAQTPRLAKNADGSAAAFIIGNSATATDIVDFAYRGQFQSQGIPSYVGLIAAYRSGQVTARDVIAAAIRDNRLTADVLENDGFVRSIDIQLADLHNI